jgi:hypothetical protein
LTTVEPGPVESADRRSNGPGGSRSGGKRGVSLHCQVGTNYDQYAGSSGCFWKFIHKAGLVSNMKVEAAAAAAAT